MSTNARTRLGVILICIGALALAFFAYLKVPLGKWGGAPLFFEPAWPTVVVIGLLASGASLAFGPKRKELIGGPRITARNLLKHSAWGFVGAIVGGVLGVLSTVLITEIVVILSPNDSSAASVGIVILALLPVGIWTGALVGFRWSASKSVSKHSGIPPLLK